MLVRVLFFFAIIFCFGLLVGRAQDKKGGGDEVIKVDTQLVDVPVVVTDKLGKPILNLKQNNFVIYEDGKKQDVTEFSSTTAPFEVALLLDTSGSTRADLQLIQNAAQDFIASLRPGDRVSIVAFNTARTDKRAYPEVEVLTGLTDSRKSLKDAIDAVKTSNGTPYYDSLLSIADKVFHDQPSEEFRGRRALVALTDGVDSTSSGEFQEARQKLQVAGITSYFVKVDTRPFFEENLLGDCEVATRFSQAQIKRYYRLFSNSRMEKASGFCQLGDFERLDISKRLYELADAEMNELTKTSGGKVFPVGDLNEARNAFKSVAAEIGTKYSVGYYPSNEKRDGSFRKITVELKGVSPGSLVRARDGYTAPAN
ncbi:MAG: VWA domain-containing protein [Acidobacteriota bacterium]